MSLLEVFKENLQLAKESAQSVAELATAKAQIAKTQAEIAHKLLTLGSQTYAVHAKQPLAIVELNETLAELDALHKQLRFQQAKDAARATGDEVVSHEIPEGRLDPGRGKLET